MTKVLDMCLGSGNVSQRQALSINTQYNKKKKKNKKNTQVCLTASFIFEKLRTYSCISVTVTSACQQVSGAACLFFRNSTISNHETQQNRRMAHHIIDSSSTINREKQRKQAQSNCFYQNKVPSRLTSIIAALIFKFLIRVSVTVFFSYRCW